jgi:hypothetical protein
LRYRDVIAAKKGTCEPVPNNLVTANWIAQGSMARGRHRERTRLRRKGSRQIDHEDLIRYESIMKFLKRDWLNFLRPVHYESNKQHDSRNHVELALLYILVNMHVQRTISNMKTS